MTDLSQQRCPKCDFDREPGSIDCPACGIVYSRYRPPPAGGHVSSPPGRPPTNETLPGVEHASGANEQISLGEDPTLRDDPPPAVVVSNGPSADEALRLRWVTTGLLASLLLLAAASAVLVPCNIAALAAFDQGELAQDSWLLESITLFSSLAGIGLSASFVLFAVWIYRAYDNLRFLRVAGGRSSPVKALVSLFVPVLNLVHPPRVVDELWRTSVLPVDSEEPASWRRQPTAGHVWGWWLAGLVVAFTLSQGTVGGLAPLSPAEIRDALIKETVALCGLAAVALFTLWLVRTIDTRQQSRYAAILARDRKRRPRAKSPTTAYSALRLSPTTCLLALGLAIAASGVWATFVHVFLPSLFAPLVLVGAQASLLGAGVLIAQLERISFLRLVPTSWASTGQMMGALATGLGILLLNLSITIPALGAERLTTVTTLEEIVPSVDPMVGFLVTLLVAVFVAPLVEEALFRGVVYEALEGVWSPIVAVVGSATLFSLMHVELARLPVTLLIGLACGVARYRTGSIVAPVAIHAANNFGAALTPLVLTRTATPWWVVIPSLALVVLGLDALGISHPVVRRWTHGSLSSDRPESSDLSAARALAARAQETVLRHLHADAGAAGRRSGRDIASSLANRWSTLVPTATFAVALGGAVVSLLSAVSGYGESGVLSFLRFVFFSLVILAVWRRQRVFVTVWWLALLAVFSWSPYPMSFFWTLFFVLLSITVVAIARGGGPGFRGSRGPEVAETPDGTHR